MKLQIIVIVLSFMIFSSVLAETNESPFFNKVSKKKPAEHAPINVPDRYNGETEVTPTPTQTLSQISTSKPNVENTETPLLYTPQPSNTPELNFKTINNSISTSNSTSFIASSNNTTLVQNNTTVIAQKNKTINNNNSYNQIVSNQKPNNMPNYPKVSSTPTPTQNNLNNTTINNINNTINNNNNNNNKINNSPSSIQTKNVYTNTGKINNSNNDFSISQSPAIWPSPSPIQTSPQRQSPAYAKTN
ncbi:hypothetical protein CYY_001807 [Polysphondylium violaceum]|uniref:Uncharacterized protein n=1 Tax=Polysphondylium violaceum TaxID=133409 RepID=A0A8J4VA92_9MYCE|nr:hypothetical protein CYY_001807 [Polysphondylium violaceum]